MRPFIITDHVGAATKPTCKLDIDFIRKAAKNTIISIGPEHLHYDSRIIEENLHAALLANLEPRSYVVLRLDSNASLRYKVLTINGRYEVSQVLTKALRKIIADYSKPMFKSGFGNLYFSKYYIFFYNSEDRIVAEMSNLFGFMA